MTRTAPHLLAIFTLAIGLVVGVIGRGGGGGPPRTLGDARALVGPADRCEVIVCRYPPAVPAYVNRQKPLADPAVVADLLAALPADARLRRNDVPWTGPPPGPDRMILNFPARGVRLVLRRGLCAVYTGARHGWHAPTPSDELFDRLSALGVAP